MHEAYCRHLKRYACQYIVIKTRIRDSFVRFTAPNRTTFDRDAKIEASLIERCLNARTRSRGIIGSGDIYTFFLIDGTCELDTLID